MTDARIPFIVMASRDWVAEVDARAAKRKEPSISYVRRTMRAVWDAEDRAVCSEERPQTSVQFSADAAYQTWRSAQALAMDQARIVAEGEALGDIMNRALQAACRQSSRDADEAALRAWHAYVAVRDRGKGSAKDDPANEGESQ